MMNVTMMNTHDIRSAAHNPSGRNKGISELAQSISRVGLLYPICVNSDGAIEDGHRRYMAMQLLGWEYIPVFIVDTAVYREANAFTMPQTGNQWLSVYLMNPEFVPERALKEFRPMLKTLGRKVLSDLARQGFGPAIYKQARSIAKYCKQEPTPQVIRRIVKWLAAHNLTYIARKAVQDKATMMEPSTLWAAIEADRPIRNLITSG